MYSGTLRYINSYLQDIPTPDNRRTETATDQLLKLQWNLRESHVLTMELLHNGDYLGNTGLSVVRPQDTTTNFMRRGFTAGITDRQTLGKKLLETTLRQTAGANPSPKGTQPLAVAPQIWSGNYFQDRREHIERVHEAQTVAWNLETGVSLTASRREESSTGSIPLCN